jgi:DNA-directed RNA polymerase subunit alpha
VSSSAPDFDKLVIDVETKPSIRPRDAIASAGKTLVELFGLARELNVEAEGIDIGPSPVDEQLAADLALPVEDLQLTVRLVQLPQARGHPHRG